MPVSFKPNSSSPERAGNPAEDEQSEQVSVDDDHEPMTDLSDILLFDQENGCYRFRQDAFDEVLAEAAEGIWSDATA